MNEKYLNMAITRFSVANTRFYYYTIIPKVKAGQEFDLLGAFQKILIEKKTENTYYQQIEGYRVCVVLGGEIQDDEEGSYIFGKFVASEGNNQNFREENCGDLYELELSEQNSRLCNIKKGALFFLLYLDKKTGKNILMFEDVSFALGIGGFRKYFCNKYSDILESFITKQKWGKDLKPILANVASSGLKFARMKIRRNVQREQLIYKGPIEKAGPLLLESDIECELILRFKKGTKTLTGFLKEVFQKEDVRDIFDSELGEVFKNLEFGLDNTAEPKFDFFDKVFKFELPFCKIDPFTEEGIFAEMLTHFKLNQGNILTQE